MASATKFSEVHRILERYLREVVEPHALCPWARSAREARELAIELVWGTPSIEELVTAAEIALARPRARVAMIVAPERVIAPAAWRSIRDAVAARIPAAGVAEFHPEAPLDSPRRHGSCRSCAVPPIRCSSLSRSCCSSACAVRLRSLPARARPRSSAATHRHRATTSRPRSRWPITRPSPRTTPRSSRHSMTSPQIAGWPTRGSGSLRPGDGHHQGTASARTSGRSRSRSQCKPLTLMIRCTFGRPVAA